MKHSTLFHEVPQLKTRTLRSDNICFVTPLLRGKVETLLMRMYVLMCAARRSWQPLGVVLLVPDELLPKILSNKFTESRLCIS